MILYILRLHIQTTYIINLRIKSQYKMEDHSSYHSSDVDVEDINNIDEEYEMDVDKTTNSNVFVYYQHDDSDKIETQFRLYGLNEQNETICLIVRDFLPSIQIELPSQIDWFNGNAQLLGDKIDTMILDPRFKPVCKTLTNKYRLYRGDMVRVNGVYERRKYPYMKCTFPSSCSIKYFEHILKKPIYMPRIGNITLNMHEQNASSLLQMFSEQNIPTAGWLSFKGRHVGPEEKITLADHEYDVEYKNLTAAPASMDDVLASPKIMSFDLEVNSSNPNAMPNASKLGDKIFQISCIIKRAGDNASQIDYLLSLGKPDQNTTGKDAVILSFETEGDLIRGFTSLIRRENPNVLVGYNIFTFDIPYMIDRAKMTGTMGYFDKLGFHAFAHAKEKTVKWNSKAYKDQEFKFLEAEGRLFIDLLPIVKRDFRLENYKLTTIASKFIGDTKDPLTTQGIFKCYRVGMQGGKDASKALGIVGKYCIKDSVLTLKLLEVLQTWFGLCEMAKTCNVQIFTLYTQGQQIRVFSQTYKKCFHENYVVENNAYVSNENERYVGAHVFDPIPGVYDGVFPFDFKSLYPTIIIAYNICYSTWVTDESIPDSMCHVMEWEDHISCVHDKKMIRKVVLDEYIAEQKETQRKLRERRNNEPAKPRKAALMLEINAITENLKPYVKERSDIVKGKKTPMCQARKYRFLKEPIGIIPTLIQNLLDARANTRKQQGAIRKEIAAAKADVLSTYDVAQATTLWGILEQRQLAYKVSGNSMYGAFGVSKGYLPLMAGAMCVTYMGRISIEKVAEMIVNKYNGKLIYGDTDTCSGLTPVLIRTQDGHIDYVQLKDLNVDINGERFGVLERSVNGKEVYNLEAYNLEVWNEHGWSKIKYIMKHKTDKQMYRVLTHTGVVDVTEDHSLLDENANEVTPNQVHVGMTLLHKDLPMDEGVMYNTSIPLETIWAWGFFMADGTCGSYSVKHCNTPSGLCIKSVWNIANQDNNLLNRAKAGLEMYETDHAFTIDPCMKSSHCNKLNIRGANLQEFVKRYEDLFYTKKSSDCVQNKATSLGLRYKKVPAMILMADPNTRRAFFDGWYAGDGAKKDNDTTRFDIKGQIGAAGLFNLASSLGYKVSIQCRKDKLDIYRLTLTTGVQRVNPDKIKKIMPLGVFSEDVYDIETESHHFSAGIGRMVVHNSNYIHFPDIDNDTDAWDYAIKVAKEVSETFPRPMELEFENANYKRFFIITKKRYMYRKAERDGIAADEIGTKGVLLTRRDNSRFVRGIYEQVMHMIFDRRDPEDVVYYVVQQITAMMGRSVSYDKFTITKEVNGTDGLNIVPVSDKEKKNDNLNKPSKGEMGSYKVTILPTDAKAKEIQMAKKNASTEAEYYLRCLPAHVQLAEKMKLRGSPVDTGTRLEYVLINTDNINAKQYEKIESFDYFKKFSEVISIDYLGYSKMVVNPIDQIFNILYMKPDIISKMYKAMKAKKSMLDQIKMMGKTIMCISDK